MKKVERSEIVDYATYTDTRDETRPRALEAKARRRIMVGESFTFLFENRETVRYQVQEMMRVERIVRESEIQHELDTYNELLHPGGALGCSLLIGIDDPDERDRKLREWLGMTEHVYASLPGGERIRPAFDARQVGDDRLSSVQYLRFDLGGVTPVAIGIDMEALSVEAELSEEQRAALAEDLAEAD